jgi:predicted transcriptional regulator
MNALEKISMGEEATLSISRETEVQLKKLAEARGETIEALAETAIREYLRQDTRQQLSQEIEA